MSLPDDHRFEGPVQVARDLQLDRTTGTGQDRRESDPVPDVGRVPALSDPVLLVPQVLGHLLVQRSLEHVLGELLEQLPGRSGTGPAPWQRAPNSLAGISSADGSGSPLPLMSLSVVVITAPSPPTQSACGPETPLDAQSPDWLTTAVNVTYARRRRSSRGEVLVVLLVSAAAVAVPAFVRYRSGGAVE